MPSDVKAAYDRAVDELAMLHSGARLAAKLNAKIIVDGNEFNNAGEMSRSSRGTLPARYCGIYQGATNGEKRAPIVGAVKKRL